MNHPQFLYPNLHMKTILEKVTIANQRGGPAGRLVLDSDAIASLKRALTDHSFAILIDSFVNVDDERSVWPFVCTEVGERAIHTILAGFVFDLHAGRRNMVETRRWYVEVFETRHRVSEGTFKLIDRLPRPYFDEVHEAAVSFRLAAELKRSQYGAFSFYERT